MDHNIHEDLKLIKEMLYKEECKKIGIAKVLIVCDKDNIGSRKSIINNGGVLENEIEINGVIEQRYWITLNSNN